MENDGRQLQNLSTGIWVAVVKKQDQRSGKLTAGIIQRILTKSSFHPHGIKVRLTDGTVGRVKEILDTEDE